MDRPTAQTIRERTPAAPIGIDWAKFGYPAPTGSDPDPLQPIVEAAVQYVEQVTGRIPIESVPDGLAELAFQAVRMRAQQFTLWMVEDSVESSVDTDLVSFTAGSYSETRRTDRGRTDNDRWVNPWLALDELLWLLMTEEKKEEWEQRLDPTRVAPAFAVVSPDWNAFATGDFPAPPSWLSTNDPSWLWEVGYGDLP